MAATRAFFMGPWVRWTPPRVARPPTRAASCGVRTRARILAWISSRLSYTAPLLRIFATLPASMSRMSTDEHCG